MKITVTKSPHQEDYDGSGSDSPPPWEYDEDGFVTWVDEVFLEGYKKGPDAPFVTLEEALQHLRGLGFEVEVSE